MSDIFSPESATASFTAVSAWAASGTSAERVTWEKPTPLTATLHRFSHMRPLPSLGLCAESAVIPGRGRWPRTRNPYVDGPRLARCWQLGRSGRLRSYVRPPAFARAGFCGAVGLPAGPDGLRGSGPKQERDV